ncbi:hypothetical protein PIB30_051604 [Stylosanthes scabra]|uniref:Flavin-containing monooxygenase n=1 Tax=Stylosanthes scabra TaxID=79078 RepID=A0ABU6ZGP4_9FABA|nr:hypothetical protein [Stylosanthes scabra]
MQKQVGIIGAGISGLIACKYIKAKGFHPIVFEATNTIGGVWTKTLNSTILQTPKVMYQFSDFPWPSSVTQDFPDHNQVLNYIKEYAQHFDLIKHIKFNTRVEGIEYQGPSMEEIQAWHLWNGTGEAFNTKGKWKVSVTDTQKDSNSSIEVYTLDFVILCMGRFSDVPNIPEFPSNKGPEKSALDTAMECSTVNGVDHPCKVLYKTEHWILPDYLPWGIPLAYLYLNRFAELMVHKPGESLFLSFIATLLAPLGWVFSKFVESYIDRKLGLSKVGMVPSHSFHREINNCLISTVPEKFFDKVEEGSIVLKKAPRFWFCKEGVVVDGEASPLKTDLVILATGFKGDIKLRNIFVSPTFQNLILGSPNSVLTLYRECIQLKIPQVAVIGF